MPKLTIGQVIQLEGGGQATVLSEIGQGGQGAVYKVDLYGQPMALKWYSRPSDTVYANIAGNIRKAKPSPSFLWPEHITSPRADRCFGYLMRLRPDGYHELGQFILGHVRFASMAAKFNAAMLICDSFMQLHMKGYAYQDLNDGNFFINPADGDVLICDTDNVMPQGETTGIRGTMGYMAPEVVCGKRPDRYSDRFSLALILFRLFFNGHPFQGKWFFSCPCLTENNTKMLYGTHPLFIFDPDDPKNRPDPAMQRSLIRCWSLYPEHIRRLFIGEFSHQCLVEDPKNRALERLWKQHIEQMRDLLITCPECGEEFFATSDRPVSPCFGCEKDINTSVRLCVNNRAIPLVDGKDIYIDSDNIPDGRVESADGGMVLRNLMSSDWKCLTTKGKPRTLKPGDAMPCKPGIRFSVDIRGINYKLSITKI